MNAPLSLAAAEPLDFRQAALLALAGSLVLYAAGSTFGWLLARRAGAGGLRPDWLVQLARFGYYVLYPYGLLLRGFGLLTGALGLLGPEPLAQSLLGWTDGWLQGALWAVGAAVLTWLALAWALRATGRPALALPRGWPLVREGLFQEAHWAFYRAALAVWLSPSGAVYASLVLLAGESALNLFNWDALRRPATAGGAVVTATLAWLSAAVFLFTGNFWLAVAAHLAVRAGLARIASEPLEREPLEREPLDSALAGSESPAG